MIKMYLIYDRVQSRKKILLFCSLKMICDFICLKQLMTRDFANIYY